AVVEIAGDLAHAQRGAVAQERVDGADIVHHVAVAQAARAAAVVGGHAADGGAIAGRYVDGKEEPLRFEGFVEALKHHARLDEGAAVLGVDGEDAVHMLAAGDDERASHRLAALRGAAAARQHRHAFLPRHGDGRGDVLLVARHDDADRLDLVDRGVGAVAAAACSIEEYSAAQVLAQALRQSAIPDLD